MKSQLVKAREKRCLTWIIIIIISIVFLLIFSLSVSLIDKLYGFFREFSAFPVSDVIINVSFILLLALLFYTFHLWKKADKELSELENIIDSINPDVLLLVDSDRNIRMCNQMVTRMFGYTAEELTGQKTDKIYFDRRTDLNQKHEVYYALEREGFHIGIATGRKKDGGIIPLEIISGNLNGREGAVLLIRDISLRKRTEQVLKETETRHRILLNSIKSPIMALGDDLTILYCNESFAGILGSTTAQLEWKSLLSVYPEIRRTAFFDAFMKVLQNGDNIEVEGFLDGEKMEARIYPTPWGILSVFDKAVNC